MFLASDGEDGIGLQLESPVSPLDPTTKCDDSKTQEVSRPSWALFGAVPLCLREFT